MMPGNRLRAATRRYATMLGGIFAVTLLAGCSSAPDSTAAPKPPTVDQTTPVSQACDANAVQYAIGAPFDEADVATLEEQSGARQVRVLRPGTAATMDYRDDRLNIHLESNGMIEALRCG
ncbi:I78 family peptidase inhibitor [Vreelandella aquamarina]|uniref:I78 family peptidase inhibitor n=1 Tax=Vreelandella aquamarina TaxID=77097 RepID=UPI00384E8B72